MYKDLEVSPYWIRMSLQKLDSKLIHNGWASYQQRDNDPTFEQETESAQQLAPSLLQRLGSLSYLKDLSIGLNLKNTLREISFFPALETTMPQDVQGYRLAEQGRSRGDRVDENTLAMAVLAGAGGTYPGRSEKQENNSGLAGLF
ncbi:hypothetical protein MVEG_11666 [Podila verticillata NRRL 6337]|uniref:Uncharacterized protein n=1 Tax=Podila verticillata NRRL 6337 TaxID=1069443 RepID=A0A086TKI0_9FUNG|nr:MAG: hypothetical protein BYD32DRAFT_451489 [Podila humilis]KFH62457.1 hypothetical protein MVEG_11666 [Podila verticillata NRRL 6337]